jgi:hypothetical protein
VRTANRNRILKNRFKIFEDLNKKRKTKAKGTGRGRKRKMAGTGGINPSQSSEPDLSQKQNKRIKKEQNKNKNVGRPKKLAGDSILGDMDDEETKKLDKSFADLDEELKKFQKLKGKLDSAFKDEEDGTSQRTDLSNQSDLLSSSSNDQFDYDDRDPSEILIDQEKEKTLRLLIKSSDIFYDKEYYTERHI